MKQINTSGKIAVILYACLKDSGFAGDFPSPTDLETTQKENAY